MDDRPSPSVPVKVPDNAGRDQQPAGQPAIRTIAMPADANPAGDIFGGWLMAQMDLAAGNVAARVARGRSATVAVDGIKFLKPVHVGDEVTLYAEVQHIGRTSMHIRVEAWRRSRDGDESDKVTQAAFIFVALDLAGRPRPVVKTNRPKSPGTLGAAWRYPAPLARCRRTRFAPYRR